MTTSFLSQIPRHLGYSLSLDTLGASGRCFETYPIGIRLPSEEMQDRLLLVSRLGKSDISLDRALAAASTSNRDAARPLDDHSRVTRAAGFTLADYRLELKCISLRGWSLFRGAIPSSA